MNDWSCFVVNRSPGKSEAGPRTTEDLWSRERPRHHVRIALALLACFLPASAEAQYQRHIEAVLPRVGQQGTTVEVVIQGLHLEDPQQVLFYRPGIRAVELERLPDLEQFDADGKLNPIDKRPGGRLFGGTVKQQVRAKFVIAPDCPIGLHPLKVRTGDHLTTLSTFWVTPYPVQPEAEPVEGGRSNDSIDSAEVIAAENTTVFGYIIPGPKMDRDIYRVTRKQGERISVEVNSIRVSSIWWARAELDLMVRILDEAGHELALCDDSALHVQDPLLSIVAPRDGDYFVEVRQSLFSLTNNSLYLHYLAHIGTFERPLAVYPAGGPAGRPLEVTMLGDPAGDRRRTVPLPAEAGDFRYDFGAPSRLPMRVSNYRNVLESAPANGKSDDPADNESRQTVTDAGELPVALNGIISRPREVDEFRLRPKKGQRYLVRVYARSLGTPLDPHIEIRHEETGDVEVAADDASNYEERGLPGVPIQFRRLSIMDPSVVWSPKQDGPYLLRIKDVTNQGGPTYVYRVEAEPVENRVNTYVYSRNYNRESTRDTGLAIPQGNRWTVRFGLSQGQGNPYRGDLKLVAEGLPEGVEMIAPLIQAAGGSYPADVPVQFVASPDAPPQAVLVRVRARPVEENVNFRSRGGQSFLFVGDHFGQSSNSLVVDQYALAVTNPAPFSLDVEPPRIPLIQNGELSVRVRLHREPGFDGPVLISSVWNPNGVGSQPTLEIPSGESEAVYRFTAAANAPPATWNVALQASTLPLHPNDVSGTGQLFVSSRFFGLTVAKPYVELASEPAAVRRGARTKFVWKVSHLHPFPASASARLLGLPKGISVEGPAPVLKPDANELVFGLRADQEALLGQYEGIGVELTFREDGQEIQQRTGAGTLRVDPALQR